MSPRLRTGDGWGIPPVFQPSLRRGWGDAQSAARDTQFTSVGLNTAGASALAAGLIPANLIPFVGPAIAGVTLLAAYLIKNSGCGQTCIQTSQWANQAADALQQNLDAYMAIPIPRHPANQQVALQNFDAIWAQLKKMCGDPQWGDAGKRCIADREQGACKWKNGSECWNWFVGYRDPIANDPNVGSAADGVLDSVFGGGGGGSNLLPLLAIGGLLAAAAVL